MNTVTTLWCIVQVSIVSDLQSVATIVPLAWYNFWIMIILGHDVAFVGAYFKIATVI